MNLDTNNPNSTHFIPKNYYEENELRAEDIRDFAASTPRSVTIGNDRRTYRILTKDVKIQGSSRCVQAITALFATIFTGGLALIFPRVQNWWKNAITGTEKRELKVLTRQQRITTPVEKGRIIEILHPKSGPTSQGGKEIQKIKPYNTWLNEEYANKQSATYKAYQSLGRTENLDNALFVGIRGDGDCGFRAAIVSALMQLSIDPDFATKMPQFVNTLKTLIHDYSSVFGGFNQLSVNCIKHLEDSVDNPEKVVNLLDNDQFIRNLTKVVRFLSNAAAWKDFNTLPEEVRMQLEFGEGVDESGGTKAFLEAHARFDVDTSPSNNFMFAGASQLRILAEKLGIGYWIGKINDRQAMPESADPYSPQNPLITLKLICRDTRHFDVIL